MVLPYGLQKVQTMFANAALQVQTVTLVLLIWVKYTSANTNACDTMCLCYDNTVDCSERGLQTLSGIRIPQYVQTLMLDGNHLMELPDLSYLLYLKKLILSNNKIREVNASRLRVMPSLEKLDLSHNHIHTLHRGTFVSENLLQELDFSYNNLTNIVGLAASMYHLKRLNLENNRSVALLIPTISNICLHSGLSWC